MNSMHKGIVIGLIVGALAYHFWMQRAGHSGGGGSEGV